MKVIFSASDALKLVQGRYADFINIKLMKCGGIREAWRIADIAETAGVKCTGGQHDGVLHFPLVLLRI